MNGGDGGNSGGESGPALGRITLEDLESFVDDDDDLDPDSSGNGDGDEEMDAMEEDRLLTFWQDVGRGHQVDVPPDMAQPIQQLNSMMGSTPEREQVPFTLLTRKEKCDDVLYEKRVYEKAVWACVAMQENTYEQSICGGFMKLMRYICEQNTSGIYLGMTVPIVTLVRTDQTHSSLSREVTVAYHLPSIHQNQPPLPFDPDIHLETWPATFVYSRSFNGPTNEMTILREINAFSEVLDLPEFRMSDSFIIAGYNNPAAAHRRNEVWFLQRH